VAILHTFVVTGPFTTDYALPSERRAELQTTLNEVREVLRADTAGNRGVPGGDGGAARGDWAHASPTQRGAESKARKASGNACLRWRAAVA